MLVTAPRLLRCAGMDLPASVKGLTAMRLGVGVAALTAPRSFALVYGRPPDAGGAEASEDVGALVRCGLGVTLGDVVDTADERRHLGGGGASEVER